MNLYHNDLTSTAHKMTHTSKKFASAIPLKCLNLENKEIFSLTRNLINKVQFPSHPNHYNLSSETTIKCQL